MDQDTLRRIGGVEIFPVISLVIFVVVFVAAGWATIRMDRRRCDALSKLPLDGE